MRLCLYGFGCVLGLLLAMSNVLPPTVRADAPVRLLEHCGALEASGAYRLANDLASNGDCFTIIASDVNFDCAGKQIVGKNFIGKGIIVQANSARVEIANCHLSNFLYGIEIQNARAIKVHHNTLSNNFDDTHGSYHGAWLGLMDGGGVRVNHSTDITLESNTANEGANGIDVRDSLRVTIRGNTTNKNSAFGIVLTNTSDSLIENNTANDNVRWCTFPSERGDVVVAGCDSAGIMLQDGSSRNRVRNNILLGKNGDGIFVRNHTARCGDDIIIEKNKIIGAVWNGIEAGFCDRVLIRENEFAQSKFGVWISYMDGVTIFNNRFSKIEQAGIVLKNLHHARAQSNFFTESTDGIHLIGNTDDEKFGWTLRHPFSYYRSYANIISGNSFFEIAGVTIRLSNSTANQIFANKAVASPKPIVFTKP